MLGTFAFSTRMEFSVTTALSGFDFDPSGAILAGVGFNCGYEPRC